MISIKIIAGSVRPGRFNIQPAEWLCALARKRKGVAVELADLAKINLPFLDEPKSPKSQVYAKPHTKAWAKKVGEGDAFVWVTPEYNHSFSPVLKNAIDFLYHEWSHKPVAFVSYGGIAGGARAAEHLRAVAGELKMYDIREQLVVPNYWDRLDKNGKYQFSAEETEDADELLDSLIFWAEIMKSARARLSVKDL